MKKLTTLLLLLFFATFSTFAQDEIPSASDTTFWDFGLVVSPEYDMHSIKGNGDNGVSSSLLSSMETPRVGFSIGINFTRQLGKVIYIQSGIYYRNTGYKTTGLQDTVLDLYDHYLYSSEYTHSSRYNSIYLPLMMRIKMFKAGKVQFNLGLGAAPQFYLNKVSLSVFDDHRERDITKAEQVVDVMALANLNIYIPLSKNVALSFEPNFSYNILGLKDKINTGVTRNLYTAGLGIQLSYQFSDQAFFDYYYEHLYKKPPKSTY